MLNKGKAASLPPLATPLLVPPKKRDSMDQPAQGSPGVANPTKVEGPR